MTTRAAHAETGKIMTPKDARLKLREAALAFGRNEFLQTHGVVDLEAEMESAIDAFARAVRHETGAALSVPSQPAHAETVRQAREAVFQTAHAYGKGDAYNSNLYNVIDALIAAVRHEAEAAALSVPSQPEKENTPTELGLCPTGSACVYSCTSECFREAREPQSPVEPLAHASETEPRTIGDAVLRLRACDIAQAFRSSGIDDPLASALGVEALPRLRAALLAEQREITAIEEFAHAPTTEAGSPRARIILAGLEGSSSPEPLPVVVISAPPEDEQTDQARSGVDDTEPRPIFCKECGTALGEDQ